MNAITKGTTKGRRAFLFWGIILMLIGIISLLTGVFILIFNVSADTEGYHGSNIYEIRTSTYAFELEIGALRMVTPYARLGMQLFGVNDIVQAKWVITPQDNSKELFSGFTTAVNGKNYISQMQTEGPPYWNWHGPYDPQINIGTTSIFGPANIGPTALPATETFWLTSTHGKGKQFIEYSPVWDNQNDNKYLVIMNLDGSRNVKANIQLAFRIPIFARLSYWLIPIGILLNTAGIVLIRKRKL
jgi:hypothetical protein